MTSTTYVARTSTAVPATDANTRTSGSMAYTHAVISKETGAAFTWHLTEAAARKAAQARGVVVAVEAHQGGKATVLRRLAAEAAAAPVMVLTAKGAAKIAAKTGETSEQVEAAAHAAGYQVETPAATGARTWDAATATSHVCAGACAQELPATSYPTTGKPGQRGVVCRRDRDAARAAR